MEKTTADAVHGKERSVGGCGIRAERSRLVKLGSRGESGEKTWTPPADWDMSQLVVYGFAVSENGQDASGTLGLIETEKTDTSVFDTENI